MTTDKVRTYSELIQLPTFTERFRYLVLSARVGKETFGWDRWLNQDFYKSRLWRTARRDVIARDLGCDLGIPGYEIFSRPMVHHMNPMSSEEIKHGEESIINPEFLITVTHVTHNAIHYGDESRLPRQVVIRKPGDTKLW